MSAPALPGRAGEPAFAEPWQAQAFAIVVALNDAGWFTWAEWVAVFSSEIARAPQETAEDSETAYFRQWLAALETILITTGVTTAGNIWVTTEHWRRSYLHTPHGEPVLLWTDLADPPEHAGHNHDHHQTTRREPVAVSLPFGLV